MELSECHQPGVLLVLSKPTALKYEREFHDWYDTEHGPMRLRLGKDFFQNGYRYKTEGQDAIWLAIYDMPDLSLAASPRYTELRKHRSRREQEVFRKALTILSRHFLQLVHVSGGDSGPANAITCVAFCVSRAATKRINEWYQQVSLPDPFGFDTDPCSTSPTWLDNKLDV